MHSCVCDILLCYRLVYGGLTFGGLGYVVIRWDEGLCVKHVLVPIGRSRRTPFWAGRVEYHWMVWHLLDDVHRDSTIVDQVRMKRGVALRRKVVEGREHGRIDPVRRNGRIDAGGRSGRGVRQ